MTLYRMTLHSLHLLSKTYTFCIYKQNHPNTELEETTKYQVKCIMGVPGNEKIK